MKIITSHLIVFSLLCVKPLSSLESFSIRQDLDHVTISGRVMDQNGGVIPGAMVQVTLNQTGAVRACESGTDGGFRLIHLPPGNYTLIVSVPGFAPFERKNLYAVSGQRLQFEVILYPDSVVTEAVSITAEDERAVDTSRTVVGTTITANQLAALPIATRSPLDLIFTLPGVSEEPLSTRDLAEDRNANHARTPEEAGNFALSGAPAYSNNLTIDGLDNNDDRAARERFQPSLEAVEEVQVITNQFSAEYGRASGGRVNLRTRSGSTQLRGRVFYFFRDEALNANTFRNNSLGLKRLPLQEHVRGFTLGGPLPLSRGKQRTFFFSSYEQHRVLDHALVDTLVPVQQNTSVLLPKPTYPAAARLEDVNPPALAAEVAPYVSSVSTPLRSINVTARIDHLISRLHTSSWVLQLGRLHNLRQFAGGNRLAEALQGNQRNSESISYSDTWVLTATLVNQTRVQFSRLVPTLQAGGRDHPVVLITINDSLTAADPARRSGTLVAGSSTAGATARREQRLQFQQLASYLRSVHSLKLGVDAHRITSTFSDLTDASGTFNFASAGDFLAGIPSRFRQSFQTDSIQRNLYAGFFVQDEWRLNPTLLLNFGLRYERERIIDDLNNFGPRLSLALDPFKSGKTVFRLGFGQFFNRVLLRTVDDFTLGRQQLFFDTNALRDGLTGNLLNSEQRRAFIAANIQFPRTMTADSLLVQEFASTNTGFSRRLDPKLRVPESYQANVGLERELGKGFSFEANFTLNRGLHLWREFNANAPVLPEGYTRFSEYLASRDFSNFRRSSGGTRPLYNATNAGELVRFVWHLVNATNPNAISNVIESGVPISLVNLNSTSSTTPVEIALAALSELRPDPERAEVEQLISAGNSSYKGLTIELRGSGRNFVGFSFRAAYTLSQLTDDGVVNTSDALKPGDFRAERARSLLDRRHRFVISGWLDLPRSLGNLRLAPILRVTSGAPFNISIGGADRNLDDVGNDRPNFSGDLRLLRWRRPETALAPELLTAFGLPIIGETGNLPRNAGRGPGQFFLDLSITREFSFGKKVRLRPVLQLDNVLNKTVFSFGSEFINFSSLSATASPEQRQAFLDSFLVATRTLRPRQLRAGLRLDF